MKKAFFLILALLLSTLSLLAQSTATYGTLVSSLSTASAGVVSGTSFAIPQTNSSLITWQVTADGSALSTTLDASFDNTTWFAVDTNTVATGGIRNYGFTGFKFVRISQVSRTGGTATSGTLITSRGNPNGSGVTLFNPSFTGQVSLPIGTVGSPGTVLGTDTTTGWYRSSANAWSFSASGSLAGTLSQFNWTTPSILYIGSAQDMSFTRAAAGEITVPAVAFAALGTPANGTQAYCSDCAPVTPATCPATKASCVCTNLGVGSWAFRANSLWYCPF